jgi:hypothetical protein
MYYLNTFDKFHIPQWRLTSLITRFLFSSLTMDKTASAYTSRRITRVEVHLGMKVIGTWALSEFQRLVHAELPEGLQVSGRCIQ